ncbi:unnamed protein product [Arabidopsis lyrata]|nr:unnamed protein product [Arabidopsis lyrata]
MLSILHYQLQTRLTSLRTTTVSSRLLRSSSSSRFTLAISASSSLSFARTLVSSPLLAISASSSLSFARSLVSSQFLYSSSFSQTSNCVGESQL